MESQTGDIGVLVPQRSDERSLAGTLPVSVVVAVKDEEQTVLALLASLDAQSMPPDEVVVVDGGSTDRTVELLHAAAAASPRYTVVVADGPATPGRGRNIGITAARNDWSAITDAGIRVAPDWLERLWEAHVREPDALVIWGNYEFDLRSFFEECAAVAYGVPKVATPVGLVRGPSVVSCLLHLRAFEEVGGFPDSRSGEDDVFIRAVGGRGLPVAWAPRATVWWRLRPDLVSTFERFRLYSYHYVLLGEARQWHRKLARSYAPVIAGLVLAAATGRREALVLPVGTIGGRVAVRIRRQSEGRGWSWRLRPDRLALVTLIMLVADIGTGLGWWQAWRRSRPLRAGG